MLFSTEDSSFTLSLLVAGGLQKAFWDIHFPGPHDTGHDQTLYGFQSFVVPLQWHPVIYPIYIFVSIPI